jgi:pimeloyl-ACP methyl ester carboxylesterase
VVTVRGAGGVDIATTDHRGDGPPLLLTHGFGGDQTNLGALVRRLTDTFRVVTFDLRNHGESGDGSWPWTWDEVIADYAAVRDVYGMERPIVAGHSLGGMVAEMFAAAHADTRAVVNIDGHGRGRPEQYIGLDPAEVAARQQRLVAWQEENTPSEPKPRPSIDQVVALTPLLDGLDMFATHDAVPCPLLIFNAHGPEPIGGLPGMEWVGELMAAYRAGLSVDLDALAARRPNIEIAHVDATHYLIFGEAQFVADQIVDFAARLN